MYKPKSVLFLLAVGLALSILASQYLGIPNAVTAFVKEKNNPEKGVRDAEVTLIKVAPTRVEIGTKLTNDDGLAWFKDLEDGIYNLHVKKDGYKVYLEFEGNEFFEYSIQEFEVKYGRVQKGNIFLFYYLEEDKKANDK